MFSTGDEILIYVCGWENDFVLIKMEQNILKNILKNIYLKGNVSHKII